MNRILMLMLVCAAGLSGSLCAVEFHADSQYGVMYTQEQVIQLPQDQDRLYLTVMGDPRSVEYRQVVDWFRTNEQLNKLAKQMHLSVMPSTSKMFIARYANSTGALPCVRVQKPSGEVVFQCSGKNLPLSADALYQSMKTSCLRHCRPQPNIHLHYSIEPKPDPKPEPMPQPSPDIFVEPDPQPDSDPVIPWYVFVATAAGALVLGVAISWRRTHRPRRRK